MTVNYSAGPGRFRREFFDRPTKHAIHEALPGDRYSPWFQPRYREGEFRVAPYLPFDRIEKDFYTYRVVRAYTAMSMDQQNYGVPANAILPVSDGTNFYEARPLSYRDVDYAETAFGDWPDTDAPINLNPFTGTLLLEADVNSEGVVEGVLSTNPTAGGIAGLDFVGVKAGSMPIGLATDDLLEGASRFIFNEFDPQESITIQTMYTLLVPEASANRFNYGQATRNAIIAYNDLVGTGTDANKTSLVGATLPAWAVDSNGTLAEPTLHDMIRPGDLVASDDRGRMVRFDVRVDDWDVEDGTAGNIELNHRYPVAAMAAVIGRCHSRQEVTSSRPLSLVKTYQDRLLGGSGTGGVEAWMLRGNTMTADEVAGIIATGKPEASADDAYSALDAEEGKRYGLMVHLINL